MPRACRSIANVKLKVRLPFSGNIAARPRPG
jgi:hypothetical protein